jgi:hypothetical protein
VNQKDESGDNTYHNMLLENVKFDALVNKIKRESVGVDSTDQRGDRFAVG